MFVTNLARARAAGLAAGGYHFFDYTLDGDVQADHFIDRLEAAGGLDDALPPVVDVECWSPIGLSIHAVSAARLRDFVERVYERTGRLPIVYTSVFMWKEVVGNAEGFEDLPLWAACWDCESPPSIAPGWEDWTFWQTGIDRIPGVGSLDGNFFGGSPEDLDALRLRPLSHRGRRVGDGQPAGRDRPRRSVTPPTCAPRRTAGRGRAGRPSAARHAPSWVPTEGSHTLHVQLRDGPKLKSPGLQRRHHARHAAGRSSRPRPSGCGSRRSARSAASSGDADVDSAMASPTADDAATRICPIPARWRQRGYPHRGRLGGQ